MKTDAQLKADVVHELEWDPSINATQVGVAVSDGVVTLSGHLATYAEKHAIERALQRVHGVRAVAVELDVKLAPDHRRSDAEIATAAESAFRWHTQLLQDSLQVKVEHGWVTLAGELDWDYQRAEAEHQVRMLAGVLGVTNHITLRPKVAPADISGRIREALARHVEREAKHIEVQVDGATVTLRGRVGSWSERQAVQGAAWSAPGITQVINELKVGG